MKNLFYTEKIEGTHRVICLCGIKLKFRLSQREREKKRGNKFILHKENGEIVEFPQIDGLDVVFKGQNCTVEIFEPCNFKKESWHQSRIEMEGENHFARIKGSKYGIARLEANFFWGGTSLLVGENFYLTGHVRFDIESEGCCSIKIGDDCMFADGINFLGTDRHTIYDISDRKNINLTKYGITVGNHVWVARNVVVLKDVTIPDNTVVGIGSIVTKSFDEENTIIGGVPAKILRRGVNWDRRKQTEYLKSLEDTGL